MSDGYEVYDALASHYGLVQHGCFAHARRRFIDAETALPKQARTPEQPATQLVTAIGELYAVEARAKELSPEQRKQLRSEHSRPILDRIRRPRPRSRFVS